LVFTRKHLSGYQDPQLRFEPGTSWIQVRCVCVVMNLVRAWKEARVPQHFQCYLNSVKGTWNGGGYTSYNNELVVANAQHSCSEPALAMKGTYGAYSIMYH